MDYQSHIENSKKVIGNIAGLDIYEVEKVVGHVHRWMDYYYGRAGMIAGRKYDYSDCSQDHRQERHHREGIIDAVEYMSKFYGEEYSALAEKVAIQHLIDDFGRVPDRDEFGKSIIL
jgi:hypothetical protein